MKIVYKNWGNLVLARCLTYQKVPRNKFANLVFTTIKGAGFFLCEYILNTSNCKKLKKDLQKEIKFLLKKKISCSSPKLVKMTETWCAINSVKYLSIVISFISSCSFVSNSNKEKSKVSVFGVILVCISHHSDWIPRIHALEKIK